MKKCLFLFPICLNLFLSFPCSATKNVATELTPVVGYRQDNIKWTLSNGASGEWKNPKFIDYGVKGKTTLKDRYVISYDLTLANLINGTFQDQNYLNLKTPSNTAAKHVSSLAFRPNLGFGYKFKPARYFHFIPQLGFVYDLIYLKTKTSAFGPVSAFKNTIQWYGPWFGFDTTTKITRRWTMNLGAAYQIAFYSGSGNWTLPPSLTQNTMSQHGTGQGVSGRFRIQYEVVKSVSLGGEADIGWKSLRNGHDSRTFANGTTIKSKLKKVTSDTWGARLVLTKGF